MHPRAPFMARFLLVDAHSVIFSWPELRALHQQRMSLGRDALLKILTEYQDITGVRVIAVFDGQGESVTDATEPGGIQVFYSGRGQTADSVIERLVAKYGGQHDLTVATNDRMEQDTAAGFGAVCVSTEMLHGLIENARSGFERDLKRRRRE